MPVELAGRDIIESGTAILSAGENTITVSATDLRFEVTWKDEEGEARVLAEDIGPKSVRLNLINAENSMGSTYVIPNAGTLNGKKLGFAIYWHSIHGPLGVSRLFSYMLTVS